MLQPVGYTSTVKYTTLDAPLGRVNINGEDTQCTLLTRDGASVRGSRLKKCLQRVR